MKAAILIGDKAVIMLTSHLISNLPRWLMASLTALGTLWLPPTAEPQR